ncbi:porin [Grimontia hollisae]|uniref:Outer membrane porin protein n=1 Tax=Grimontia hollisae CIP 101886 TaxID=675812 RepID=D0ICD8_GRIHO|nr:porin [Grimontia hollisae]AMG29931.1 porin [Grimontia hollisae]EEY71556.1 outer membrane porin protein [Grimontia hollisae CIP 101886]STO43037.1 Porin OmpF [Grimontia hollisae]
MEKMFKRSVLGAAVALAAVSGSANAAIELAGDAVQLYGQAAGSIFISSPDGKDDSVKADIESRIGFRGRVQFEDFGPDFIWQMEGGNANNGTNTGGLGARDTFLGFDFDGVGSFKYGRQLVAAYNYVDWPHSNPGLGNVFDWNNDIGAGFSDRADHVLRFDSASFGGFNFQATVSGMGDSTDQLVSSIAASYSQDMFTVHAGVYDQKGWEENVAATKDSYEFDPETGEKKLVPGKAASIDKKGDLSYYIVGGALYLGDVTLTAAFKSMENGVTNAEQDAYSATAQYIANGQYVFKLGYAATTDSDNKVGYTQDDSDTAITGRIGYLLPSAYLYFDVRNYDMASYNKDDKKFEENKTTNFLIGAEYYF